ncbi:hypothetical protein GCM10010421_54290 [Streptomyces glaucus]|uniref:Secreted protein n=1 Tax=Streptomyces glaucus TaxID=284029 RepID=A0ABP5XHX9_9ACTN
MPPAPAAGRIAVLPTAPALAAVGPSAATAPREDRAVPGADGSGGRPRHRRPPGPAHPAHEAARREGARRPAGAVGRVPPAGAGPGQAPGSSVTPSRRTPT